MRSDFIAGVDVCALFSNFSKSICPYFVLCIPNHVLDVLYKYSLCFRNIPCHKVDVDAFQKGSYRAVDVCTLYGVYDTNISQQKQTFQLHIVCMLVFFVFFAKFIRLLYI